MKVFDNRLYNLGYFAYRLVNPIIDPINFIRGLYGYIWFFRDLISYKVKDPDAKISIGNLYPMLHDKTSTTHLDAHYFHQQLWVFEKVLKNKPLNHTDISSTYQMSGYLSKVVPTTFIDYRPIETNLKNLTLKGGDILNLDVGDNSIESLSCLHVIEHIGLGRYGDSVNPKGTILAANELSRILKKKGKLYFSIPIGKEKICFNAHRIYSTNMILNFFKGLKLKSFSVVDDDGVFHENVDSKNYNDLNYGCGMFEFTK